MAEQQFDVFLCHNSLEKSAVEKIRDQLRAFGIHAWLDKYDFELFRPWQDQLEEIIPLVKAAAIFIGPSGVGPWADIEMREFLKEFAQRRIRMGLVILPSCPDSLIQNVPRFVKSFHWVDFRQENPNPMEQLIWGITGQKPAERLISQPIGTAIPIQNPFPLTDNLASEKGIDYTRLRDLLKAGKWKDADQETYKVIIRAIGKQSGDWFAKTELLNFPCEDLKTIDGLWVKYSQGRFGFSVQQQIYVKCGAKLDGQEPSDKTWERFCDRVGWRKDGRWLGYSELNPSSSSPRGIFPCWCFDWFFRGGFWVLGFFSPLASRFVKCKL